jgi:signal transduction histidine kinase
MALTTTTEVDIVGQTQTISFYESSTLVDQITFSSNTFTFQTISTYNLSKSDFLLYWQFLNTYWLLIITNFGKSVQPNLLNAWPLSQFDITESSSGVTHLYYTQTSAGTTVNYLNYVPIAQSISFAARASPVTISLQEMNMAIIMLYQYQNQVSFN